MARYGVLGRACFQWLCVLAINLLGEVLNIVRAPTSAPSVINVAKCTKSSCGARALADSLAAQTSLALSRRGWSARLRSYRHEL